MRKIIHWRVVTALVAGSLWIVAGQITEAQSPSGQSPFVVEYYYKAKWGYADEFIRLFKKNHYPVLKKQVEAGRMLSVTAVRPRYHTTEDGRWDYRVTITFKNLEAAFDSAAEEEIIKGLYRSGDVQEGGAAPIRDSAGSLGCADTRRGFKQIERDRTEGDELAPRVAGTLDLGSLRSSR